MKMLNKFVPILLLTLLLVSNVSCVAAVDNGSQTNHITSDNVNHIESPDTLEQIYNPSKPKIPEVLEILINIAMNIFPL